MVNIRKGDKYMLKHLTSVEMFGRLKRNETKRNETKRTYATLKITERGRAYYLSRTLSNTSVKGVMV